MSVPIDDGGLAFPFKCQGPTTGPEFYYGMSLRDYFAAKALPSAIREMWGDNSLTGATPQADMAMAAYQIADAMLEARKEKR